MNQPYSNPKSVNLRLSEDHRETLSAAADLNEKTLSAFVRESALTLAKMGPETLSLLNNETTKSGKSQDSVISRALWHYSKRRKVIEGMFGPASYSLIESATPSAETPIEEIAERLESFYSKEQLILKETLGQFRDRLIDGSYFILSEESTQEKIDKIKDKFRGLDTDIKKAVLTELINLI